MGYGPWGHEESDTTEQLSNGFYRIYAIQQNISYTVLSDMSTPNYILHFIIISKECQVFVLEGQSN